MSSGKTDFWGAIFRLHIDGSTEDKKLMKILSEVEIGNLGCRFFDHKGMIGIEIHSHLAIERKIVSPDAEEILLGMLGDLKNKLKTLTAKEGVI